MKVEVFSQWNELECITSSTRRTGQNMKAKTTVLELHSEHSEPGHRLDSSVQRPCSPHRCSSPAACSPRMSIGCTRGARVSLHTGDAVVSARARAAAHLTSKRVFKISQRLTENMHPAAFPKSYMYADMVRTSRLGEMAQPLTVRLTTKNIRMPCF